MKVLCTYTGTILRIPKRKNWADSMLWIKLIIDDTQFFSKIIPWRTVGRINFVTIRHPFPSRTSIVRFLHPN